MAGRIFHSERPSKEHIDRMLQKAKEVKHKQKGTLHGTLYSKEARESKTN